MSKRTNYKLPIARGMQAIRKVEMDLKTHRDRSSLTKALCVEQLM